MDACCVAEWDEAEPGGGAGRGLAVVHRRVGRRVELVGHGFGQCGDGRGAT